MNFQATINGQTIGYSLVKLFPLTSGLNGQWFNPEHAGEGFFLPEDGGRLAGAYFTHDSDGKPVWYTFDCQRTGSIYTGPVYFTEGGEMGVPHDPLESVEVGAITFSEAVIVEPPPVEPPPVEPPPPLNVVVEHKLGNTWHPLDVPVMGTIQGFSTTQIRTKKLVREYRITADQPLQLASNAVNHDPAYDLNPTIQISGNNVKIFLGPSNVDFPGLTKHAGFRVDDSNLGTLIDVRVQVGG